MPLSERDHLLLCQIERRLADADPGLEKLFGRLPAPGPDVPPRWSRLPPWMLVLFLCAFIGWTVSPHVAVIVLILAAVFGLSRLRTGPRDGDG